MKSFNRRNFLKTGATGLAGLTLAEGLNAQNSSEIREGSNSLIVRQLGNTGINVPVVSIGVGACDSPAVIKGALKLGIKHFDTAYVYQNGNSEKMLGEVLKNISRDSFTIATKVKTVSTKKKFLEMLDKSLDRLQMKYVDILYLHAVDTREELLNPEMLEALKIAKESGKALHVGVSTHKNEPEVIQAAIDSEFYEVVLTAINFKQEHHPELKEKIALANKKGLGIVAMKVMAGGFLDKAKTKPVNYKAALKWVLQDENVHTAIPSIVNLEQLMDNASLLQNLKLTENESKDLASTNYEMGLYCNACSKCIDSCRKKLPIPELMRAYMYTYGYQETVKTKELVASLNLAMNPCIDCNDCSATCIKGFNISKKISDIARIQSIPTDFLT